MTKDSKNAIDAAQAAYDALTDDQKALVKNYQTLVDAALAYDKLVAEPDRDLSLESLRQLALQRLETLRNTLGSKAESAYKQGVATVSAAKDKAAVEKAYQAAVVAMRKAAGSYGKVQVIVENTTYAKKDGAAWDGTLVNTWVNLTENSTIMSCVEAALKTVKATGEGFERNYISSINGLKEFDGSASSGWMGMTADWEEKLLLIEKGEYASEDFMDEIKDVIAGLIQNYEVIRDSEVLMSKESNTVGKCPVCGDAVEEKAKAFFCSNRSCKFALWKNNRYFESIGKRMTSATAQKLLGSGKIKLKGCKSAKTGNTFDATVYMEVFEDGKTRFNMEFDNGGKRK